MDFIIRKILSLIGLFAGIIIASIGLSRYFDIWKAYSDNFFIIVGILIVLGSIFYLITREDSGSKNIAVIINILAILATISAALFGAYLGSSGARDLWKEQNNEAKQNVAAALYVEISSLQEDWSSIVPLDKDDIKNNKFSITEPIRPYYSDKGLYYSFQTEIASYNPNLSTSLYIFYNEVIKADNNRVSIIENLNGINQNYNIQIFDMSPTPTSIYNFSELEIEQISKMYPWGDDDKLKSLTLQYYNPTRTFEQNSKYIKAARSSLQMKRSIIKAYDMIPPLLTALNNERNANGSVENSSRLLDIPPFSPTSSAP